MRHIVAPYVPGVGRPETLDAVAAAGMPFCVWPLPVSDDGAYPNLVARLWGRGEPFLLVEHDMVPDSWGLVEMAGCGEPWCTAPYETRSRDELTDGLGVAGFGRQLLDEAPDLLARVFRRWKMTQRQPTWQHLDLTMVNLLRRSGWAPHVHRFPVEHLRITRPLVG